MKKNILILFSLIVLIPFNINAQNFQVNTKESSLKWRSTKVNGEHSGFVKIASGNIVVNNGAITSGEFIIDMKGILVTDTDDKNKQKDIVDDISGKTFYNVAAHPTAKFVIKGYSSGKLIGDLTIKGITNQIEFKTDFKIAGNNFAANAPTFIISRKKWKLKLSNWIKQSAVDDELEFTVLIKAKK